MTTVSLFQVDQNQITERGHSAVDVAKRLGITDKSLYRWKSKAERQLKQPDSQDVASLKLEIAKLQKALKRATEEREILKKAALYFHAQSRRFSGLDWRG